MAGKFGYTISLKDEFGGELRGINLGLGQFEKLMARSKKETGLFASELGRLSIGGATLDFSGLERGRSLLTFDLVSAAQAAASAVRGVASAFVDLSKSVIKVVGEAEDINLAVRLNVGTEQAGEVQKLADLFASKTRFDDDEIKKAIIPLAEIGIKDAKLFADIAAVGGDLAARTLGKMGLEEVSQAFRNLALKGEIDNKVLKALGIESKAFFAMLGDRYKVSAEAAEKMAKGGKIATDELIRSAIGMVAARQGGTIGGAAIEAGSTMGASIHRLENLWGNMWKTLAGSPAMVAAQRAIEKFTETMSGPTGERIVNNFGAAIGKVAEFAATVDFSALVSSAFTIAEAIGAIGSALAWLSKPQVVAIRGLVWFGETLGDVAFYVAQFGRWVAGLGTAMVDGLVNGITGAAGKVYQALRGVVTSAVDGVKGLLEIRSPSKVFEGIGGNVVEGFAQGIESMRDRVEEASRGSFVDTPTSIVQLLKPPEGGAPARSLAFSVAINVNAHGNPEEIGAAVERTARATFRDILDEIAVSMGA